MQQLFIMCAIPAYDDSCYFSTDHGLFHANSL